MTFKYRLHTSASPCPRCCNAPASVSLPDSRVPRHCDPHGLQLETACLPGGHLTDRSDAIRDAIAGAVPGAETEPAGLFTHALPQRMHSAVRQGMRMQKSAGFRLNRINRLRRV